MRTDTVKLGKLSWGLIVLFIGIVLLLDNLTVIRFNWWAVIRFWPVLIILFGLNVLLPKNIEGQILSVMATLAALAFFTFQGLTSLENNNWFDRSQQPNENQSKTIEPKGQLSSLSRDYDSTVRNAILNISGGAVEYRISETSNKLIEVEAYSNVSGFSLSSTLKAGESVLDLSQKGHKRGKLKKFSGNNAQIRLNPAPFWDINLELGAGTANFNLKPFRIRNMKLKGGASSISIALGMPSEKISKIEFDGGVSSLKIQIPKSAGCRIEAESALSSLDFLDFSKQEDGSYITENYNEAEKRFEIALDNGLSSIEITRYDEQ